MVYDKKTLIEKLKIASKKPKIYFDMDGVLAKYQRRAYEPRENNVPLFMDINEHYFDKVIPDTNAIDLLRQAAPYADIYILTTIDDSDKEVYDCIKTDKIKWIKRFIPEIDTDKQLIISKDDKSQTITVLEDKNELDDDYILIDDFNYNLISWEMAKGLAIKYVNGINSKYTYENIYENT